MQSCQTMEWRLGLGPPHLRWAPGKRGEMAIMNLQSPPTPSPSAISCFPVRFFLLLRIHRGSLEVTFESPHTSECKLGFVPFDQWV